MSPQVVVDCSDRWLSPLALSVCELVNFPVAKENIWKTFLQYVAHEQIFYFFLLVCLVKGNDCCCFFKYQEAKTLLEMNALCLVLNLSVMFPSLWKIFYKGKIKSRTLNYVLGLSNYLKWKIEVCWMYLESSVAALAARKLKWTLVFWNKMNKITWYRQCVCAGSNERFINEWKGLTWLVPKIKLYK